MSGITLDRIVNFEERAQWAVLIGDGRRVVGPASLETSMSSTPARTASVGFDASSRRITLYRRGDGMPGFQAVAEVWGTKRHPHISRVHVQILGR